jgi:hypothetical protein
MPMTHDDLLSMAAATYAGAPGAPARAQPAGNALPRLLTDACELENWVAATGIQKPPHPLARFRW